MERSSPHGAAPAKRNYLDFVTDGQWWVVPYFARSDGGWYQSPAFEAKNIDVAKIRLYPELWEACLAVSDPAKELYGWGVTINRSNDGDWFRGRVTHGWGAYIQDETGQFVTINSPEMVEAMTVMTDLYMNEKWAPMLPPGILAWTDSSNNETYLAGKLAYTQNGGTVYGKAQLDKNPIKDITRFHSPAGGPVNKEFNSLSANYFMLCSAPRTRMRPRGHPPLYAAAGKPGRHLCQRAGLCLPAYDKLWDASKFIPTNPRGRAGARGHGRSRGRHPGHLSWAGGEPRPGLRGRGGIENDMVAEILRGTPVADAVKTCHERYVAMFKEFGYQAKSS